MTATPMLPLKSVESRFTVKSGQMYDSMRKRFAERKSEKTGRITQIGRTLPFSKEQFRDWLIVKLGGEGGVIKCRYCAMWLSINEVVLDHADPVSQGGSLGLDNLDLICHADNSQKGAMRAESYEALLEWSALNMRPACRADMLHRLAIAVQLAAQKRWDIIKEAKKKSQQQQPEPQPEEF